MIPAGTNIYLDADAARIRGFLESNDRESERLRHNAFRLIIEAMNDQESREITSAEDLRCLPLTLWILRRIGEPILTSRVLNHARDLLEGFLMSRTIASEFVPDYARRYGVTMEYDEMTRLYMIRAGEFVNLTSRLSGYKYRLIYQSLRHGTVYCDREVAAKIVREAFVRKLSSIFSGLPDEESYSITAPVSDSIDEIIDIFQKSGIKKSIDLGEVDATLFTPCIKEYITQMRDGVNLPHMARFTLVSFLHKIGMNNEGIIGLFKTAPDFNERMTTYQVNHVTGEISSTEYSPPKCTVLRSNHLCYWGEDPVCHRDWLKHPLQYYTYKKRKKSGELPLNKAKKS